MNEFASYNFYPSLLDSFQYYLDADARAEEWWNIDENGNYRHTPDEIAYEAEKDLLNAVNRCKTFDTTLADRGTCFNDIVDEMVKHRYAGNDDVEHRELNGHSFKFDVQVAREVAAKLQDAECQYLVEGELKTKYGLVNLYGYADYWWRDKVIDLKTTAKYEFGKYMHHWQRYLYPYCLVQNGYEVNWMEFLVVQMKEPKKTGIVEGEIYTESYNHDQRNAYFHLRDICERFIEWLESKREFITDLKIFNQHNKQ